MLGFVLRRIWNPSNLLDSTDSGASITTVSLRATAAGGYVAEEALDAVQTIVFDVGVTEVLVEFPTLDDLVQGGGGLVTVELLEDSAANPNIGGTYEIYDRLNGVETRAPPP